MVLPNHFLGSSLQVTAKPWMLLGTEFTLASIDVGCNVLPQPIEAYRTISIAMEISRVAADPP
jgi:hypothetical protein